MFIEPSDLAAFADIDPVKAAAMVDDAEAMAVLAAPCLSTPEFQADPVKVAAVKAILRGALLRWNDAGSGMVTQQGAGPFQQTIDTKQERRGMFWPSEISQLRDLCSADGSGEAFSVDTVSADPVWHSTLCALRFGAAYCSCGADLTGGGPLFGGGL